MDTSKEKKGRIAPNYMKAGNIGIKGQIFTGETVYLYRRIEQNGF